MNSRKQKQPGKKDKQREEIKRRQAREKEKGSEEKDGKRIIAPHPLQNKSQSNLHRPPLAASMSNVVVIITVTR